MLSNLRRQREERSRAASIWRRSFLGYSAAESLQVANAANAANDDNPMTRTILLSAAAAIFALLACLSAATAADPLQATIVERGIYKLETGERSRQSSGVMTTQVSNICHVVSTTRIPARLKLWFGFRFRIDGPPPDTVVPLRLVTHFPRAARPPRTAKPITAYERPLNAPVGLALFTGYGFDEDWEFMAGTWVFEIFDGDRKLAEQRFTVIEDGSEQVPTGDGRVDCFAMTRLML